MGKQHRTLLCNIIFVVSITLFYATICIPVCEAATYEYTTPGTFNLTLPEGTKSITVTSVGGGGGAAFLTNPDFLHSYGGVVGENFGTFKNCGNSGTVTGDEDVGGIVGENRRTVENCGWLQGTSSVGIGVNYGDAGNVVQFNSAQRASVVTTAIPSIDKTTLYADKRETATISFTTYLSEPSNRFNAASGFMRNIKATSSAPDVVSIVSVTQSAGTVILRAEGSGTAEITVTADLYATNFANIGGYVSEPLSVTFTYHVTSIVPLEGIFLSADSLTLSSGSSTEISVIYTPENATNKNVTWTSSNTDLVSVEPTDTIGTAKITAIAITTEPVTITTTSEEGGYTASITVSVVQPIIPITLKIVTEDNLYPCFGTLYLTDPASGSVIKYPGTTVSSDGSLTRTVLAPESDFFLGVSLLNSLVSGTAVSPDTEDFTDSPLYMVEGDLNSDNVIDGTDYTILVQRMHYNSGLSDYGLVGDLNYDGQVNDQDLMFFNSPVTHTGEPRFMHKGFDMTDGSVEATTDSRISMRNSVLQIEPTMSGSYEISFKEATEPANMLQVALAGDIYDVTPSLPEGYELIGEHYDDGRTVVAIGSSAKDGVSIPADTPILSVQSASEPRIDYAHSSLQKATEAGVVDLPLTGGSSSLIDVPTPAAPARQSGSSGCNTGLGVFALLTAVPLFLTRKR